MVRQWISSFGMLRTALLLAGVTAALAWAVSGASAQGLVYEDADDFFNPNLTPVELIDVNQSIGTDNLWGLRVDGGAGATVYESLGAEDVPSPLTQTISGLTPGTSYEVYVAYWTDGDENWAVRTGLSPGAMTLYNFTGNFGRIPQEGATPGITAAAVGSWTTLPPMTRTGAIFTDGPVTDTNPAPGTDPFDRVLLLGLAGTTTPNAQGEIEVLIDDNGSTAGAGRRTWFDGVAYRPAAGATPLALTATLDANTGALTLSNPTTTSFQIKSYTLNSPSGSLDAASWTPITGNRDGAGNGSFDSDAWAITAPVPPALPAWTNQLAEGETPANNGGTLAAGGGVINFGNVYNHTRFQDVQLSLTLADNSVVTITPQYNGSPITPTDFNLSGSLTIDDYQILMTNLHSVTTGFTQAQASVLGDVNGDTQINFTDFAAFRSAWDAANGAGSFAQLVAQVPEPASLTILLVAGAAMVKFGRRHARGLCRALLLCGLMAAMAGPASAVELAVDIDTTRTSGTATAGPLVTQSGFTSWDLTNVLTGGSTTTVEGITFEIFGLAGANQSRVRVDTLGVPNGGGGEFNDLLADFVYNEGANGRAIGLRITGLPVGTHAIESWHFDAIVAQDMTQVEVRNQGEPGSPSQVLLSAPWSSTAPIKFLLDVREPGQVKEIIFREASGGNRARLNGFSIGVPVEMSLEVNTTTGAMRFLNEQDVAFDLSYYEIKSFAGALNTATWTSLDDAEGGDPLGSGWDEAMASNANILSEGNLQSMQTFAPDSSASLGSAFTVGGAEDIRFFYASPTDTAVRQGIVKYVTGGGGDADFDNDSDVDGRDFLAWQRSLGATVPNGTGADASGNGLVDAADLNIWKSQFGNGAAAPVAAAIPEPASLALLAMAGLAAVTARRRVTLR